MSSFCTGCGNSIAEGDRFCRVCGRDALAPTGPSPVSTPPTPGAPTETSGKAIFSLVCGLLVFIPLAFIAAIVLGHMALSEIRRSAGRLQGEGMAIAGLVLGYAWVAGIPVILVIAAIAIPNLLRARMAANESSAVASIRTINTAELTYSSEHPSAGFTCSLPDLSSLLDSTVARGQKSGYRFELSGCAAAEGGAIVKYQVVAYPVTVNTTGIKAFCSDETAVIKMDSQGSARGCLVSGAPQL